MKKTIYLVAVLFTTLTFAQKMKVQEGNIKNLKGIAKFELQFDYTDVEIPKYKSEEAFLEDKVAMREEKEEGSGEKFKKSWFSDRAEKYEPKFIESFNKRFKKAQVVVSKDDADYIMHIHTTFLYAGYNVGIVRQNSKVSAIITVSKKSEPNKVLLKGKYNYVQGNGAFGFDFDSGYRISEAYAKLAKNMAVYILKKAK